MSIQKPLNILIAVHHFPPTFKGGAEWRAHRTAKWMQQQGHTVRVICVDAVDDLDTEQLRYEDQIFDGIPVRRLYLNLQNAPEPATWEYENPWIGDHLNQYLKANKPDLVHLISGYLMTAAAIQQFKAHNLPMVATLTDFWFLCPRHTLQRTSGDLCPENSPLDCARCHFEQQRRFRLSAQKMPRLSNVLWQGGQYVPQVNTYTEHIKQRQKRLQAALSQIDIAISPSKFLRDTYLRKGYQAKQMLFMRQGLKHIPTTPPEKTASDTLRIGYIGGIAPHKGVQVLVEAFLKLQTDKAELKLYGDTSKFAEFTEGLKEKSADTPQLKFMGTFDNQQISEIHANLDVLVVPSVWYENSPNVILESFAHRTPVITSNLGGMAELVQDDYTGLLFEPNNGADLAQKLALILDTPSKLITWQQNLKPLKSLETEMNELAQIYNIVLHAPNFRR
ncbi:glycosyltransferase family 4 protein [Anaerolineales bacterium HSG24]|nr:glycosyltransferase family 4 protein [Anaerolineales bacterium HSG24]